MQNTINHHACYESPLTQRYSSQEMSRIFSQQYKHETWRKLWIALAEAEQELGLPIKEDQIKEMKSQVESIDFEAVDRYESQLHHDVMAHIHAYGDVCPSARPIIHLGATSCYVTDNTDLIQMKRGLALLIKKLRRVIEEFAAFARKYAHLPCLGYTHLQPAQLTTVGKRACLWIQDLLIDLKEFEYRDEQLMFLGVKGATGTQASFLSLFNHNREKVKQLDTLVAEKMGFSHIFGVSGQTYTRKQDAQVIGALAGFAASCHKFGTDLRLLMGFSEIEEAVSKNQVGSSAMPHKKNPILSERLCSLARYLISLEQNPLYTHATQWLERSLDDSANRRLCLAESFLTADALVDLLEKIVQKLHVNEETISHKVSEKLPHMALENILMAAVSRGGDRQHLHEKLRVYSREPNSFEKIISDPDFNLSKEELEEIVDVQRFIGRAPEQVEEFVQELMGGLVPQEHCVKIPVA